MACGADRDQQLPEHLAAAPFLLQPMTQRVLRMLEHAGFSARVIGGAVRDQLLGEPVADIDIATNAHPQVVVRLARAAGMKAVPTGIDHGTVTLIDDEGRGAIEVTTLRRDVATDGRRAVVAFTDDWLEDAGRRDFTINALSCDAQGRLSDPVGGLADLAQRRVRFIGVADERIREDYLRILRLFRFSARYAGGTLDPEGLAASLRQRHGLALLSAERISAELLRILVAPAAVEMVTVMAENGFIDRLTGLVPLPARFARTAAIEHAHGLGADPIRRLAALSVMVGEDARRLATVLRLSAADAGRLAVIAGVCERVVTALPPPAATSHLLYRLQRQGTIDALTLDASRLGIAAADPGLGALLAAARTSAVPQFPLSGKHLLALGHAPGPAIGATLRRLEQLWIASDFELASDQLLQQL